MNALEKQEGGNHYQHMAIQPVEYIEANGLSYLEGNVIKYISRHRGKGMEADMLKAIHYCELILHEYYGRDKNGKLMCNENLIVLGCGCEHEEGNAC
jgi:hypothetical protein